MPLKIVRNDITKMSVDAIVNAANSSLLGGGGVDGCIHRAAGPGLLEECRTLGGCRTGEAKITRAYRLPCRYVIHTVGPVWNGGHEGEERLLSSCYRRSLCLAREYGCETVAFPLISAGAYGYPKDEALRVAVDTVSSFLLENDMTVYLVIFDRESFSIGKELFADIREYISDRYVEEHGCPRSFACRNEAEEALFVGEQEETEGGAVPDSDRHFSRFLQSISCPRESLADRLENLDESFSQMLLREIDERGMTDAQCYKRANVDRKLFSKIRSDVNYRPSKPTAIAFAIALELSLDETAEFLKKAGFALSHSNKFDIIIEYFIAKGNYNIFEINDALFAFDQSLLG